jgi:Uridine kinase
MGILRKDNNQPLIIGICGRSCSGKGVLTEALASTNREVLLLSTDCYFRSNSTYTFNGYQCWEHSECIDFDRLVDNIRSLKNCNETVISVETPWMPHVNINITRKDMSTKKLIIVEGFLLFVIKELSDLCDYKLFIHVSDYNILYRRQLRNGVGEINYVHDVVIPISKEYEQEQRNRADIVICGDNPKDKVINEANKYLSEKIAQRDANFNLDFSSNRTPWTVYSGDLLMDTTWHPIDFENLKDWVKKERDRLDVGEELKGNTFRYRRSHYADGYEIRLSSQYNCKICRYTAEPTQPW